MKKSQNFIHFLENLHKIAKIVTKFSEFLEFGAVQKIANIADLEKRCKMSTWLQKSALIQKRTSCQKFAEASKQRPTPGQNSGSAEYRTEHLDFADVSVSQNVVEHVSTTFAETFRDWNFQICRLMSTNVS